MPRGPSYLVVGAGVSGLAAALELARRGERVRVVERAARSGGLAAAETFRGVPCDLGSHRLHPSALELPLFRELSRDAELARRPRRGVLLVGGRRVPYPPSAVGLARALGPRTAAEFALGFVARRRRHAFRRWDDARAATLEHDDGFERFVRSRVGDAAYRAFYAPYAEKVWGLAPSELSQSVAKKRVSTTTPLSLFRGALGRAAARGEARGELGTFLYPARGIASIVAWLEERLSAHGVRVEHGTGWSGERAPGERVLHAGRLADLVPTSLEHRGIYLVYLALGVDRVGDAETYYSPDRAHRFGRVSELKHYAPALGRPGETILCVEIPEGRWGSNERFTEPAALASLRAELERAGIVPPGVPLLEATQRFVPGVYPLYRRGWIAEWRRAMREVARLGDVFPFGRQGLFLHCNLDHCVALATEVVDAATRGATPDAWIESAERWLGVRVRD